MSSVKALQVFCAFYPLRLSGRKYYVKQHFQKDNFECAGNISYCKKVFINDDDEDIDIVNKYNGHW